MEFESGNRARRGIVSEVQVAHHLKGGNKGICSNFVRAGRRVSPYVHNKKSLKYFNNFEAKRQSTSPTAPGTQLNNNENCQPSKRGCGSSSSNERQFSRGEKMVRVAAARKQSTDGIWRMSHNRSGSAGASPAATNASTTTNNFRFTDGGGTPPLHFNHDNRALRTYSGKKGTPANNSISNCSTFFAAATSKDGTGSHQSTHLSKYSKSVTLTPLTSSSPRNSTSLTSSAGRRLCFNHSYSPAQKSQLTPTDQTDDGSDISVVGIVRKTSRQPLAPIRAVGKSSILADISSQKIDNAYGPASGSSEKENVPVDCMPETPIPSHLLGFPNLGNTCYLNAVLQSLVALRVFRCGVSSSVQRHSVAAAPLLHSIAQLLMARASCSPAALRQPLRLIKENFERLDSSFVGWKMQDANEFLTKILDTVKDEVNKEGDNTSSDDQANDSVHKIYPVSTLMGLTAQFGPDLPKLWNNSVTIRTIPCTNDYGAEHSLKRPLCSDKHSTADQSPIKRLCSTQLSNHNSNADYNNCGILGLTSSAKTKGISLNHVNGTGSNGMAATINPITDNFGFQLHEVYHCLGCSSTVKKSQEYFSLYVHLSPCSEDDEDDVGPASIRQAVADYMKMECRELKCECCGHNQSEVTTRFTKMPRILIIQVKRYMFNASEYSSLKVRSSIQVNKSLNLSPYTTDDASPYPSVEAEYVAHSTPPTPFKMTAPKTVPSVRFSDDVTIRSASIEDAVTAEEGSSLPTAEEKALTEEEQFQEAVRRSLEDAQLQQSSEGMKEEGENKEEQEEVIDEEESNLQAAIRLSLQEARSREGKHQEQEIASDAAPAIGKEEEIEEEEEEECDEEGPHTYQLASIVSHFGRNTTAGHYVCDVLSEASSSWLHYDDETVTETPQATVLGESRQRNGYIFFYVHRELVKTSS